jgi:uncharacterized OsmC-like protein
MSSSSREYSLEARSSDVFGRVLLSSGTHHFIVDGPEQSGCPGEAITPVEVFLSGVAACGVELVQVVAREEGFPLESVRVGIRSAYDRENPVRNDCTVFNRVEVDFTMSGVTRDQAELLLDAFRRR